MLAGSLSSALAKRPPVRGTVWRGIGFRLDEAPQAKALEAQLIDSLRRKRPTTFRAYTSSDLDPETAFGFGRYSVFRFQLTIISRDGSRIRKYSQLASFENEVLFDRDSLFLVTAAERTPDAFTATLIQI